mmetsp:Transcript_74821/g.206396  ORF Transcript_74821/g.206396 Transcript_74821/m.206396 type:complete len:314 (-) Transcript_74821:2007-2948(-)
MPQLASLNLADNYLTNWGKDMSGVIAIATALKESQIRDLNLAGNNLTNSGKDMTGVIAIAAALKDSQITDLNVNKNYIIGDAAEQLAKVVLEHGSLTNFGGIPMAVLRENSLAELDLNENGIGLPGALVLANLLPAATALKSCNLDNNALCGVDKYGSGTYTIEGITALCEGIKQSNVQSLSLADNNLTNYGEDMSGVIAIAAALKDSKITDLNVKGNDLGNEGSSALGQALLTSSTSQLAFLTCDKFSIGPDDTSIDLSTTNLSSSDAILLAGVLKANKLITHVNLQGNDINDEAANLVVETLKHNNVCDLK